MYVLDYDEAGMLNLNGTQISCCDNVVIFA